MALQATVHNVEIAVSDVDRGVYETLELRVAQHPSETMRFLVTRVLAYALSYEEGIAFSKGGLSDADEAPIALRDPTGVLLAWIDIGSPAAERLHKASKAARRVAIFTSELANLRRNVAGRRIHRGDEIEVWPFEPSFVDGIVAKMEKRSKLELTRNDGTLYVVIGDITLEAPLVRTALLEA
jgi:uncharacterized protein YaeQ